MDAGRPTDTGDACDAGDSRDVERIAAGWLARRDRDGWTARDADALEAWLEAATTHRVAFLRLQAAWAQAGRLKALGAGIVDGPPARGHWFGGGTRGATALDPAGLVFAPRAPAAPRRPRHRVAALATAAVLALAMAWGWQWQGVVDASSHRTALGGVEAVPMADGSRTTLSSDSRIEVRMSRRGRHVDLRQGEALFEAARDPRRPFVVRAGGRQVVAVGTRFAVRRDGPDLRVVVTEGTVRLESLAGDGPPRPMAVLPAGSVARVNAAGVLVQSVPVADAERLLEWQEGLLAFQDTPLADAAAEFNRYNARKLVIADATIGGLRLGGRFRWSNAEGFARLLEQGFPVRADYQPDRIVLHAR